MTNKYIEKELFDLLKYHCEKDLNFNQNLEIRFVRVLKSNKLKYFKNENFWLLFFFSNDLIDFTKKGIENNHINFYTINSKDTNQIFLVGLEFYFLENGTKKENRFCFKSINPLLNNLIRSKYNITTKS